MSEQEKTYELVLKDIIFRGYHLRFKEDFILKYMVYDELENGSGYYTISPNNKLDFSLMIDGWYGSKESFIKAIYEEIVVDYKLYVKDDKTELTEKAKEFGEQIKDLIEPIETFEDSYDCITFVKDVMIPPLAPQSIEFCNQINKMVNRYGYKLTCVRIDNEEEN